jgi:hypothetical protein
MSQKNSPIGSFNHFKTVIQLHSNEIVCIYCSLPRQNLHYSSRFNHIYDMIHVDCNESKIEIKNKTKLTASLSAFSSDNNNKCACTNTKCSHSFTSAHSYIVYIDEGHKKSTLRSRSHIFNLVESRFSRSRSINGSKIMM